MQLAATVVFSIVLVGLVVVSQASPSDRDGGDRESSGQNGNQGWSIGWTQLWNQYGNQHGNEHGGHHGNHGNEQGGPCWVHNATTANFKLIPCGVQGGHHGNEHEGHHGNHGNGQGGHHGNHGNEQGGHHGNGSEHEGHHGNHGNEHEGHHGNHGNGQGGHHGNHGNEQGGLCWVHNATTANYRLIPCGVQGGHHGNHGNEHGGHHGNHGNEQGGHHGNSNEHEGHHGNHGNEHEGHHGNHGNEHGGHHGNHGNGQGGHHGNGNEHEGHHGNHGSGQGHHGNHGNEHGGHHGNHGNGQEGHHGNHGNEQEGPCWVHNATTANYKLVPCGVQGGHHVNHGNEHGGHHGNHGNQQGGHHGNHGNEHGGHHGNHGNEHGGHHGNHTNGNGPHNGSHGNEQGGHHGNHGNEQGGHHGQHGNQHGGHNGNHGNQHGGHNGNHGNEHGGHHGNHHGGHDDNRIPIPIISDKAASAIVQASSMLTDALKAASAEEVYDKTGVLTILRALLMDAITTMNTLFTEVSGAVSDRITRNRGPDDPLSELMDKVAQAVREFKIVLRSMEGKVKPSELSDIENAIEDIAQKVSDLKIFRAKGHHQETEPISTHYHHGLDLTTVIEDWATAIESIANSMKTFATAVQKVITTRTLAITVQKSIHKSLAISGSYLSSVSKQLNSGLESLKTKLGQFAQMTVTQLNQAYSSITSNPTKWHHRLLNKLYEFLAAYSDYVHREYLRKIASTINEVEQDIVSEIIKQTRKSGLEIAQAATHISDKAAASFNHKASTDCALKQITKLMGSTNSISRLAQCVSGEINNLYGLHTRGQQMLTQAKDNAANIVNQLTVCNSGTDDCYQRFTNVFDHKKSRAREDLKNAGEQIADALQTIGKRIENCLEVVAEEIKTTTKKCKKDFDFCARF
ncbi:filaggrin-like isoform X3 [Aedes albopictus]|uniref:Uncharacterized protein n=1 Tax=Aedes albopictus TaxID=7160 RepID=A0ABM1Z3E8_AEDAL